MLTTLLPLPDDALEMIATSSGPMFTDLFPVIAWIAGILLAIAVGAMLLKSLSR